MFKLVVLSALLAFAVAKPSIGHAGIAITPAVAVPSAVSYQSRTDIISKPVVETYAAAPLVAAAPVIAAAIPALSYSAPAVAALPISAPVIAKNVQIAAGKLTLANTLEATAKTEIVEPAIAKIEPEIIVKKVETPVVSEEVKTASVITTSSGPTIVKSVVSAPATIAYTAPSPLTYAVPAVAYSAPAVAYSAPAVSTYIASPVLSSYAAPTIVKAAYAAPAIAYSNPAIVRAAYTAPANVYSAHSFAVPTGISTTNIRTNGIITEAKINSW